MPIKADYTVVETPQHYGWYRDGNLACTWDKTFLNRDGKLSEEKEKEAWKNLWELKCRYTTYDYLEADRLPDTLKQEPVEPVVLKKPGAKKPAAKAEE